VKRISPEISLPSIFFLAKNSQKKLDRDCIYDYFTQTDRRLEGTSGQEQEIAATV